MNCNGLMIFYIEFCFFFGIFLGWLVTFQYYKFKLKEIRKIIMKVAKEEKEE